MRLTAQSINDAAFVMNPLGETVLQLRGLQIPTIENLGVTRDMYQVIDLTDNQIIEVKNIPRLKKLECLLLSRNNIVSVGQLNLGECLPNLGSIMLINNNLASFNSLRGLFECSKLAEIALLENDITLQKTYRIKTIWLIPSLKVLDFAKVKESERIQAEELFGKRAAPNENGQKFLTSVFSDEVSVDAEIVSKEERDLKTVVQRLTEEERAKLVAQLESAESLDEIERIEALLR